MAGRCARTPRGIRHTARSGGTPRRTLGTGGQPHAEPSTAERHQPIGPELETARSAPFQRVDLRRCCVPRLLAQTLQDFPEEATLPLVERPRRVGEIVLDLTDDVLSRFVAHRACQTTAAAIGTAHVAQFPCVVPGCVEDDELVSVATQCLSRFRVNSVDRSLRNFASFDLRVRSASRPWPLDDPRRTHDIPCHNAIFAESLARTVITVVTWSVRSARMLPWTGRR